ncbi:vitamin K epoxide reductase family protein [Propionicicella superfundia]|uniref:vitamin K epoxide reductase family protein n=1 Tax=Propionicicella superfundia TaxID=348582 RepID=UPI0004142A2A|nr:vitamin K epoxide reductase family protein [Propionicicella superfundia]
MTDVLDRVHGFRQSNAWIFSTMLVSACLSLLASFVLSIDAVELARDPNAQLSCNINAAISCGTVGVSWQARLFGFPNAFLGLVCEPVVITIAVASLAGVRFPRGFMLAAQIVYTLGVIFAYWLFFEAMFVIGALCPWCLLVTLSTTLVFTSLTHVNIRDGNLFLPPRAQAKAAAGLRLGLDALIVTVWLGVVVALIFWKYGAVIFS